MKQQLNRRRLLVMGVGVAGTAWLAACGTSDDKKASNATVAATSAAGTAATAAPAQATDLNEKGWPKNLSKLSIGQIPLEDKIAQLSAVKPMDEFVSARIGVPVETAITTSYAALVQAQKNKQVLLGYYGPLSFLLAEQQFNAVPILVDSSDGKTPGSYTSMVIAGKDSGIKSMADLKGRDFAFADPASTSGNLVPRSMMLDEGIDPIKDVKGRFAGSHANVILAVGKGQVPAGGTNNINLQQAIDQKRIAKDDVVILKTSAPIPNGPFAVGPDLDKRAVKKLQDVYGEFNDEAVFKAIGLQGRLIPTDTALYDPIRKLGKLLNLQFDEKGNPLPVGG